MQRIEYSKLFEVWKPNLTKSLSFSKAWKCLSGKKKVDYKNTRGSLASKSSCSRVEKVQLDTRLSFRIVKRKKKEEEDNRNERRLKSDRQKDKKRKRDKRVQKTWESFCIHWTTRTSECTHTHSHTMGAVNWRWFSQTIRKVFTKKTKTNKRSFTP